MRRTKMLLFAPFLLGVAGCSMPELVEEKVLQVSGIAKEESYQQYETLKREGKLDENGYYKELGDYEEYFADSETMESMEEETGEKGQVRVTFAGNSLLDVKYYFDKECKNEITDGYCYLNPGESIYASQPKCDEHYSNIYRFSEFRIFEYDSNGGRKQNLDISSNTDEVLTIPEDFSGTELAVEPIGEFAKAALSLRAYKQDENGGHTEVSSGTWKVNDKNYSEDTVKISPGEIYTVTYEYDAEEYYVADTSPECFSNRKGVVEFKEASLMDENNFYSVELHPYITLSLEGELDKIAAVKIGNKELSEEELERLKAGKDENDKKLNQLKQGEEVSIVTTDGYQLVCTQFSVGQPENPNSNESRYTFSVPQTNENNRLYVSKTDLQIDVDRKVGNDISFDIKVSGITETDLAYQKGKNPFTNGKSTLYKGTVGAEEQIEISAEGKLDSGNVLRIEVTKTDGNSNKKKEIHYLSKVPDTQAVVIYENGKIENKSKIFKSIDIEIGLSEDVEEYQQEEIENGVIELEFTDVDLYREIGGGDIVEDSRKVNVIITPKEGYEISGKDVSKNRYEKEMTYKKYKSQIKNIIDKHPIEKKSD